MKAAIIYHSEHHGNTKKLLDAMAMQKDITLISADGCGELELAEYDLIGFASGIYYQKFHESVLRAAEQQFLAGASVFLIYTYGVKRDSYPTAIREIVERRGAKVIGTYCCPGYDTFGPFKLVGGIDKGRPNEEDIAGAVNFYQSLTAKEPER